MQCIDTINKKPSQATNARYKYGYAIADVVLCSG